MRHRKKQMRGFTLVELLIASAVFAVIMVIMAGTFSQANSFEGKIAKTRAVSEISMQIADQITRDIREAKGEISTGSGNWAYDSGVVLLNCTDAGCDRINYDVPGTAYAANTLVVFSPEFFKIYYSAGGSLYFKKVDAALNLVNILTEHISTIEKDKYRFPNQELGESYDVAANFGGFAPYSGSNTRQQPYINFQFGVKTRNYDISFPADRAAADLQSSVTLRSYGDNR